MYLNAGNYLKVHRHINTKIYYTYLMRSTQKITTFYLIENFTKIVQKQLHQLVVLLQSVQSSLLHYYYIFIYCSLPSSSLNHSAPAAECRATLVQRRGAGSSVEYPIRLIWTSLPDIENGHKHQCRGKQNIEAKEAAGTGTTVFWYQQRQQKR